MLKKIGSLIAIYCALLLLVSSTVALAEDASVTAIVSRTTVQVGEQSILQVEVKGSRDVSNPVVPRFDGLEVYPGGTSSSFQIVNGSMQSSKTFTYSLVARKAGKYKFDDIKVLAGGNTVKANPVEITVTDPAGGSPGAPPQPQSQQGAAGNAQATAQQPSGDMSAVLMFKGEPESITAYPNQEILLRYVLYKNPQLRMGNQINFENYESTLFQGFWQEDVPMQPGSIGTRNIGNNTFEAIQIKMVDLFPIKPGQLTISPLTLICQVEGPRNNQRARRGQSPFDDFFNDDFFMGANLKNVRVPSNAVTVNVLPLPEEGKPAGFTGAVGKFNLTATLDKSEVQEGSPITLRVRLEGKGNLRTIGDPELPSLDGFEQFEGTRKEDIKLDANGLHGGINYEYVLIPQKTDIREIGSLRFSFFDPEQKRYSDMKTNPIPLVVRAREKGEEQGTPIYRKRRQALALQSEDFRHVATDLDSIQDEGGRLYRSVGFGILTLTPWGLVLGTWIWRRRKERLESDPKALRKRRAYMNAMKSLKETETRLAQRAIGVSAEMEQTLIEYLNGKFNTDTRGLTSEQLTERLCELGAESELANSVGALLRELEEARYSPEMAEQEADQLLRNLRDTLSRIEKV